MSDENACFVAGTLVHTRNGLVQIEQIRAGDWVLSQPDNESGAAPSCKQVVSTFAFDDKSIFLVRCYRPDGTVEQLGVTGNHPFRVKGAGWTRADQLGSGTEVELLDGTTAITLCASPLMRSAQPGVGWTTAAWGVEANDGAGNLIDLRMASMSVGSEEVFNWDILDSESEDPHFKARVFNLEIEKFHTYYVGGIGVWVHDTNCGDTV